MITPIILKIKLLFANLFDIMPAFKLARKAVIQVPILLPSITATAVSRFIILFRAKLKIIPVTALLL